MHCLRLILIVLISLFSIGCSTRLNGNVHLLKVGQDNNLYGPWYGADDKKGIIPFQEGHSFQNNIDSYTILFNEAFFNYLPDPCNSNEVIVIFTFKEDLGGQGDNEIVKIIGPMKRIGDQSFSSAIGKVMYGPKRTESSVISVKIQIVEYDAEETEDSAAFLDFIGGAAETFSIADPVTSAQISVAKEIAKTIIRTNKNDIVLEKEFDIFPYDKTAWIYKAGNKVDKGSGIPLKAGNYAIIKQEQTTFLSNYWVLTKKANWPERIVAIPFDLVSSIFVMGKRLFTDLPSPASRKELTLSKENNGYKDGQIIIRFDENTRKLMLEKEVYKTKTWLTFSIEQGRNPSKWENSEELLKSEKIVNALLKNPSYKEIFEGNKVDEAIQSLQRAREKAGEIRSRTLFTLLEPEETIYSSDAKIPFKLVIQRPKGVDEDCEAALRLMKVEDNIVKEVNDLAISKAKDTFTPITAEYEVTSTKGTGKLETGEYRFYVDYKDNYNAMQTAVIPFLVVDKPKISENLIKLFEKDTNKKDLAITLESGNVNHIQSIEMEINGKTHNVNFKSVSHQKIVVSRSEIVSRFGDNNTIKVNGITFKMKHGLEDVSFSK
ncbi:MAG: hypothetical protein GY737_19180 [Desulfobacteraceae bacterium]|nr:hypothetical protein [Desulfobacteraceae bacterium]